MDRPLDSHAAPLDVDTAAARASAALRRAADGDAEASATASRTDEPAADEPAPDERDRFLYTLSTALARGALRKLVLSKPATAASPVRRLSMRPLRLRGEACLSFVEHHATREITRNLPVDAGLAEVAERLGREFLHGHLYALGEELELLVSRKGRQTLRRQAVAAPAAEAARDRADAQAHDRAKTRWVDIDRPFLAELGVTDAAHRLVPAMARKWRQINKFVEVFDQALERSRLGPGRSDGEPLTVADFGAGKGYLTFALHDHLRHRRGIAAEVRGIELRDDLVQAGNHTVARLGLEGLAFEQGDVQQQAPAALDVMIALHACDTATDHAIAAGVRAGAAIIMCSPCCHKELRPQMALPAMLRPMLQHGIHLGQQAEMLTDSLRALLLEASGYDAQVFEFVALEHTSKNKMILAVRRERPGDAAAAWQQVRELKACYGIREQRLERLLARHE